MFDSLKNLIAKVTQPTTTSQSRDLDALFIQEPTKDYNPELVTEFTVVIDNNQMAIVAIDTPVCTVSTKQEAETANRYFNLVEEVQNKLQAIVTNVNVENKQTENE
jgi:hypothetical protein